MSAALWAASSTPETARAASAREPAFSTRSCRVSSSARSALHLLLPELQGIDDVDQLFPAQMPQLTVCHGTIPP